MMQKRKLTSKEIEDIVSQIRYNEGKIRLAFPDTYDSVERRIKERLKNQLSTILIYSNKIPRLKEEILYQYNKSLVNPGESVGVIAAQSIGERQTQTTLSAFHVAGVSTATVTTGVPRFGELLSATKKPKHRVSTLYFKTNNQSIDILRKKIVSSLISLTIADISNEIHIFYSLPKEEHYKIFEILYSNSFLRYSTGLSIYLNKNKLLEYNLNLEVVSQIIEESFEDVTCVWFPIEVARIDVFVDIKDINKEEVLFITNENASEIYLKTIVLSSLKNLKISGIEGITNLFFIPDKEFKDSKSEIPLKDSKSEISPKDSEPKVPLKDSEPKVPLKDSEPKVPRWAIETEGTNLLKVFELEEIDKERSISNDMWEIYSMFGIEAARQFLIEEYTRVISSDGTWINPRHIQLLVDMMTFTGTITSVSRYGISKDQASPLARASFEVSVENFIKSGVNGEIENNKGVSASIISGKVPKIGTGMFDVKLDMEKIINN